MAYKKIIILSIVFAFVLFGADKLLTRPVESKIPDPEQHIREIFGLLQTNDVAGFEENFIPEDLFKEVMDHEIARINNGMSVNLSMDQILNLLIKDSGESPYENFVKEASEDFEEIYQEGKDSDLDWKNAELIKITWKMNYDEDLPGRFKCNSKIFVKSGHLLFCIKYKDIMYYKGVWYPGTFTEMDDVTPDNEFFPDIYLEPSVGPYMDGEAYDSYQPLPYDEPDSEIEQEGAYEVSGEESD